MFLNDFIRYLSGYVNVSFSGDYCERILNLCARNHISLWNIKRNRDNISANISVNNFKKIKKIRAKSRVSVKINKKIGVPFFIKRYKLRWGIPIGLMVFIGLLIFLQSFIWQIYVTGNEQLSEKEVIRACNELGIDIGTLKTKIDTIKSKEELLIKIDNLSWATFNIEGSRLTVNVSENKGENITESGPSNIYSRYDGVIKKIIVKSGTVCVKVGDAVLKNDILVKGENFLQNAGITEYSRSQAEILAQTNHEFSVFVKYKNLEYIESRKMKNKKILYFFGINIPLYLGEFKPPYKFYESEKYLTIFNEKLPIFIKNKTFIKLEAVNSILTKEQAVNKAKHKIEDTVLLNNYISAEIENEKILTEKEGIKLIRRYKCVENIAYEEFFEENILK